MSQTIEVDASQTRSNSSDNTKDTCIKNGIGAKREVGSSDADDGDKSGAGVYFRDAMFCCLCAYSTLMHLRIALKFLANICLIAMSYVAVL